MDSQQRRTRRADDGRGRERLRLLLDEHIVPEVADRLVARGYDVIAVTRIAGLPNSSDDLLLTVATEEERVMVTRDRRDFMYWHRQRLSQGAHHGGILLVGSRRFPDSRALIGQLVRALEERITCGRDLRDSYEYL